MWMSLVRRDLAKPPHRDSAGSGKQWRAATYYTECAWRRSTRLRAARNFLRLARGASPKDLLAAQYHGSLEHEWQVVVQSVEDIGECRKKSFAAASK
jgi:hypothetical protein